MPEADATRVAKSSAVPGFRIVAVLHESSPTIVYRALSATGEEVVLKTLRAEYPRKEDAAEVRREYRILSQLQVPGVIRARSLVEYGAGNAALELESFGRSLADLLNERQRAPLPLQAVLSLITRLARTLGDVHQHDLVHKNVVPQHVLVDEASGDLRLIDFSLCSELSRERQSAGSISRLEGSLPYLSPEQTGRTGRDVDYRSDFYSLGVTLFELLTGTLPFTARDPLEWVHRHISQTPPAASDVNPNVPPAVSAIASKLMAKSAEDRYQSSYGLISDLERCQSALAATSWVAPFALGQADVSRRFQIPQRLYGREAQMESLVELFEGAAHGAAQVCLVSGYAGIGKSALVAELGRSIVRERGYLVEGKFDQFHQSAAYAAFAQAFRGLVDQLLGEPQDRLECWRESLQAAIGANGQLIVDLVPELALIVGPQRAVPRLPPAEALNRFQIVFVNFVRALAARQHPLVVFMDDLQWSDVPTLNLFARLAAARDIGSLLLVGAYRSSAVDPLHPLSLTIDQMRKTREVVELSLGPLEADAVDRLTADTVHTDAEASRPLSRTLLEKAQGNPFFIREILKRLNENGAIRFDADAGRWTWDMTAVRGALVGENVVDFMVDGLRRLPERTQGVLRFAACIGNTFDLQTLAVIATRTMAEAAGDLQEALVREMVVPLSESYKFAGADRPDDITNATYRFQHDRVQQAAYELIDPAERQAVHLSIGRLMRQHAGDTALDDRVIDIVSHLNAGRDLVVDPLERRDLASLNLTAGLKAVRSSAYESALGFVRVGQELLGPSPWDQDFDLMLALSREVQQCAYLTAAYDDANAWAGIILERARTPLVKAEILAALTRQYSTMGRMRESIDVAFQGLALLGVDFIAEPTREDVDREIEQVTANLAGRDISALIDAPEVTSTEARIAIRILMEVFPAAFLSGSGDLFPYLVLKPVNLSLRHGNSPEAAFAYAAYGMLLCGVLNDPARGLQYAKLAVAMNERFNDIALRSRILYVYAMFVHHWSHHWSSMTPWFLKGIEAGYQSGDLLYLAYSAQDCVLWDPTLDLATATREQRKYLAIVKDAEYRDSYDSGTLFLQMQLNFQGMTESRFSMNDASFDEEQCVAGMRSRGFMTGIANYHIYKAEIHALYGDYAGALEHVVIQDGLIASAMSLPQLVRFYIVAFLTRAAVFSTLPDGERARTLERLRADLKQMTFWASNCRENFEHLRLTMQAELSRLDGRLADAMQEYDDAADAARSSGFLRDEAVACELAARCLLGRGFNKAAEGYLRAAHHVYHRWGAARKVTLLEEQHPFLTASHRDGKRTGGTESITASLDSASLDVASVMKASQTISAELVLDQLLKTTLHIMLESAGGQRGFLVVREEGRLMIRAHADTGPHDALLERPASVAPDDEPVVPFTIVNSVLRTGTPLVLEDAAEAARFASDPYIVKHRPRSVMCVPIRRHERFSGAVYMENNLSTAAFTQERVDVVKLLAAQTAISMENATLYEGQVRLIQAQQRFVPAQFLKNLGRSDIAEVGLGEFVARDMSVLFADLRDFTPLTERLGPNAVIALLNRYFSRVGGPIAEAGGFIDSFNGDEIMALFPLPAERAVEAAVNMRRALAEFNRESMAEGGPHLDMGIGINTGPLVLGTVGSHDRLKCGVVGDTVNTAARVEQLTKFYNAPLLIGEQTHDGLSAPERFSMRPVDRVAAKGKLQAITLYEVLDGETSDRRAAKERTRELLEQGMERYFARDFAGAHVVLASARAIDPEDCVLAMLAERARGYAAAPPSTDWQGVETLHEK
jgi:predicted ATPase/class 3 adenylate cyclase/tRNA A-37 threonylcarbamoyl transferase component Bud32